LVAHKRCRASPRRERRAPPYPCRPLKSRRGLSDLLARVQDLKKRRIDDEGLGIAHQLLLPKDRAPQGLQEAPELAQAAVEGRGVRIPATPGKRWEKKRWASRRKERSLSTPLSCWKRASARTSESERRLSAS
jgi:hypothetical protein